MIPPAPPAPAAGRRVVIDPVTRIEGHLRLEVNVDAGNVIRNAVSVGTMWRGLELILKDRDPRDAWAFAQRVCGVCTGTHALASLRAVEDALGITIPPNANLIRNIMLMTSNIHDHLVHFYLLHALDWVDVMSALKADPAAASAFAGAASPWPKASPGYFRSVQEKLARFVGSGQLGPFRNGYWGHPAYRLPPEVNLVGVAHYLEALDFQREIVKIHTVLGGKNPHPNWLVGGVPAAINAHGTGAVGALNVERIALVREIAVRVREFIDQVYVPDLLAIAGFYRDWTRWGGGLSSQNLMAYGDYPVRANDRSDANMGMPGGLILGGNLRELRPVDLRDPGGVQEFAVHSWYKYPDEGRGLHPWDGITECDFRLGPAAKTEGEVLRQVDEAGKYSYIKAPRYQGHAVEVGPLARLVIGHAAGRADLRELVDGALKRIDAPFAALFSTLGRTLARALECQWLADRMLATVDELIGNIRNGNLDTANTEKWSPATWPASARGVGACEAARGSLGHWVRIEAGRIANYQCVVPTTWNASPRDTTGQIGAYEAALLGVPLADPSAPLEVLRVVHSFDPCMACSTHLFGPDGAAIVGVEVQ
ncbi:hydrogenase 1 large subunit [Rhodovastum atsumiense]|uniref:Uptake hydrogenase large subunit n=1 Tax=Rhodovastum atsumiense TaxID=504468 RepID=A0A5M6IZA1_9PROT|nr:nickel-dependent hydrogenase large subunit [Rhodovastum atsumiense]KAA5612705.1 nickel-dependent hydrogenase large subunit [Rhodovastum atsumiense]CAH2602744.1 hydrogenase 1 large subunit [Rhodovastum atsumiense]